MGPGGPAGPGGPQGPGGAGPPQLGLFSSPSACRTALLNASGLGAGYAYLKQWPFFVAALIITVGLLITAGIMGAADSLLIWVPIFLAWLTASAVHGLVVGRDRDRRALIRGEPLQRTRGPLMLAVGLVLAVTASLTGVWQTGEWQLRSADDLHREGRCTDAVESYERIENGFQISFSSSLMDRAREGAEACAQLQRAEEGIEAGAFEEGLDDYASYFEMPRSVWEDTDGEIADIHLDYAENLAENEDYEGAQEIYAIIPQDYEGTDAADAAPGALMELYRDGTSSYGTADECMAFEEIDLFAGLDWDAAPSVETAIDSERPDAALGCGWYSLEAGDPDTADDMHTVLAEEYPDHRTDDVEDLEQHVGAGYVEQEMDELIAVGEETLELEVTDEGGGDNATLAFGNDSPHEMKLLYVGADGVHGEVTADACEDCEVYDEPPEGDCTSGIDTLEAELKPGEYRIVVGFPGEGGVLHGEAMEFEAGESYEDCFFLVSG
ncbi:DUF1109 domain-containing protein [Nocardiopsis sp. HNM0947]|uniref:DUF1109 domain-containing protein n=1 Tax=Nocardiopsis coralli TaxID=2772213 RepID=A0ABR9P1V3_9ACTN|nr:DUF1109 domain-containing protein [Nocardiopsis coralli]MBE2997820.1 DUF1109 domain-containing protein [Nocardiopsis coralli]